MKKILLTEEQYSRLKKVLDRACEDRPSSMPTQELWHACARATTEPDPAPPGQCAPSCLWCAPARAKAARAGA